MKVIGINGSPRKTWHSAQLLDNALEGARAAGAETKRIDLFDLDFAAASAASPASDSAAQATRNAPSAMR